ncbi:hypothetical protein KCU83_g9429, partial [Aureobasidium melanogenum]
MSHIKIDERAFESLRDAVTVITGGAAGIGEATVRELVLYGAKVVVGDVQDERGAALVAELGSMVTYQHCDTSSYSEQLALFATAEKFHGRIDIAIANAGISRPQSIFAKESDWTQEPDLQEIDINLKGAIYTTRIANGYFRAQGTGGDIIITSSISGWKETPGLDVYTASKHGVIGLVRSLRLTATSENVRLNTVCPWMTRTNMTSGFEKAWMAEGLPTNEAIDVAHSILHCACVNRAKDMGSISDAVLPFAGNILYVAGGETYEVDHLIQSLEPQWLGYANSEAVAKGQRFLAGILQPKTLEHIPGTVLLDDEAAHVESQTHRLRHAKAGHILLSPQPSKDPSDPLNWSGLEKHIILAILCYGAIICAAVLGPLISSATVQLALELHRPIPDIAVINGYLLLTAGAAGPFVAALSRKYGKRPAYIFSSTMALVGCIVGETSSSYNTLLAARIIQGLAQTAYESLILASIGDLFFVHERGTRVGLVMFILTSINNGTAIISGVITADLGWTWNFHILLPFTVLQLILLVLFVPETTYRRSVDAELDIAQFDAETVNSKDPVVFKANNDPTHMEMVAEAGDLSRTTTRVSMYAPRKSFWQRTRLYNGTFVEDSVFKMVLACLAVVFNVVALYNIIGTGLIVTWTVATSFLSSLLWTRPPYNLSTAGVGYVSVGPLIGGIIGAVLFGIASDPSVRWLTKRNRGVYEPEFRLVFVFPSLILSIAGLLGFGYACQSYLTIYSIAALWGLLLGGIFMSASVMTTYALDACRQYATEIFIMAMTFKNFFFYGFSAYFVDWFMTQGVTGMYNVMGGITGAICLASITMYVFGKKYRHYWHYHNVIKKWHLETDKTGADETM